MKSINLRDDTGRNPDVLVEIRMGVAVDKVVMLVWTPVLNQAVQVSNPVNDQALHAVRE